MKLKDLGFNDWFRVKCQEDQQSEYKVARVVSVNKDNYVIRNKKIEIHAEITGKIRFGADSNLDLPTVGDWVFVQYYDNQTFAIIHDILPRKSLLKRKTAGKSIEYQLIAANIDTAFIIQSLDVDFNIPRLERYLVMVNESNITPIILLSKLDLISSDNLKQKISQIQNTYRDYNIIAFSNVNSKGIDDIQNCIKLGKTYCLLGSSGVGKTTLLNKLMGENIFKTGEVRNKDSKGTHITTQRQLVILDQGGLIIDNPGMRELGNIGVDTGLDETFKDIVMLSQQCHFNNCTHTNEPGCSVLKAVEKGEISEKHYQNYIKIQKESEYYSMSYVDKRQKNKKTGKLYKQIMKEKKDIKSGKFKA
ncbi:MAG: ribosome small subunit-dependent GTPase A [bacterium]